ncbi:MAG: tRNA pseudouridine(38-40) synthase TruA [Planctomycetota bacterium]
MRHLKLTVAYDGTEYCGWQIQNNGVSIQQKLEEGWTRFTSEKIRITASGRTDAGVHALAQVCSLKTENQLPPERILRALNTYTPYDIAVTRVQEAPNGFHAIRDAVEKTYCYHLQYGRIQDPLRLRTCWFLPGDLHVTAMAEAAVLLTGKQDFASFQSAGSDVNSTVRTIFRLHVESQVDNGFPTVQITVSANGFLYNMVRNIVGCLVEVGKERQQPEWVRWLIEQKNRSLGGQTAPANGLFLDHVIYDE